MNLSNTFLKRLLASFGWTGWMFTLLMLCGCGQSAYDQKLESAIQKLPKERPKSSGDEFADYYDFNEEESSDEEDDLDEEDNLDEEEDDLDEDGVDDSADNQDDADQEDADEEDAGNPFE